MCRAFVILEHHLLLRTLTHALTFVFANTRGPRFDRGARGGGFTVLKPGVHIDRGAITRHIGSQNANPGRFYSNPVPWMGPLRRNQLQYNMKLKFEVELQLSVTRDPDMLCRRPYDARPPFAHSTPRV